MSNDLVSVIWKKQVIAIGAMVIIIGSLMVFSYFQNNNSSQSEFNFNNLPTYPFPGNVSVAPDFTLPNINGQNYTFSADAGKIRLVDFFYTKCQGNLGCSLASQKLFFVYSKLKENNQLDKVRIISIDFDYINDTMSSLRTYANTYTQDTTNWQFLLGNETQTKKTTSEWGFYYAINNVTANVTTTSLQLNHGDAAHPDPYVHSLIIYFIDQSGHWRYAALGDYWTVTDAYAVITALLNEQTS